jgi:hypothetical protein
MKVQNKDPIPPPSWYEIFTKDPIPVPSWYEFFPKDSIPVPAFMFKSQYLPNTGLNLKPMNASVFCSTLLISTTDTSFVY